MSFYGFDNSYMLEVIENHPSIFSGIAVVNHNMGNLESEMIQLANRGVRGFRVHPTNVTTGAWLDTEGYKKNVYHWR